MKREQTDRTLGANRPTLRMRTDRVTENTSCPNKAEALTLAGRFLCAYCFGKRRKDDLLTLQVGSGRKCGETTEVFPVGHYLARRGTVESEVRSLIAAASPQYFDRFTQLPLWLAAHRLADCGEIVRSQVENVFERSKDEDKTGTV